MNKFKELVSRTPILQILTMNEVIKNELTNKFNLKYICQLSSSLLETTWTVAHNYGNKNPNLQAQLAKSTKKWMEIGLTTTREDRKITPFNFTNDISPKIEEAELLLSMLHDNVQDRYYNDPEPSIIDKGVFPALQLYNTLFKCCELTFSPKRSSRFQKTEQDISLYEVLDHSDNMKMLAQQKLFDIGTEGPLVQIIPPLRQLVCASLWLSDLMGKTESMLNLPSRYPYEIIIADPNHYQVVDEGKYADN